MAIARDESGGGSGAGNSGGAGGGGAPTIRVSITEPLCSVFRRSLKRQGQKYTPERAHVLDAILAIDDVFQVEQVQRELSRQGLGVSKATTYRTIKLLQDAGIIQQVLFDADHAHYQLAYGKRPRDLLVRVDTNEIIPIEAPELLAMRDRVCEEHGLRPEGHRFVIYARGGAQQN